MIDNFEIIKKRLNLNDPNYFYRMDVIRRGKDHPNLPSANRTIKSYFLTCKEDLDYYEEAKKLADIFGARIYINPTRKSYYDCLLEANRLLVERLINKDFKKAHRLFNRACGLPQHHDYWIIDVDYKGKEPYEWLRNFLVEQERKKSFQMLLDPESRVYQYLWTVPTANGYHIIVYPFDSREFVSKFPECEIKKNGLTLVYAPDSLLQG